MATNPKFEAVLFDLDGVLTSTAALHARSWKAVFDELLIEPFDIERDYLAHVDGKPSLPRDCGAETVCYSPHLGVA